MKIHNAYNSSELPKQLTEEETKKYFELLRTGSKMALNTLVEHNLRLVIFVASNYDGENVDPDDLISAGNIGLIKAVKTFDISKNYKFATYASRCINNEILMHLRKNKRASVGDISLDQPAYTDDEDEVTKLIDIIPSNDPDVDYAHNKKETHDEIVEAMAQLTEQERQIILGLYGDNLTQAQVAAKLDLSQSYVSRVSKSAGLKIAKYITSKYKNNLPTEYYRQSTNNQTEAFTKKKK